MMERLAVVGPTAVGKTAFAVQLATMYDGELINADSRQVLRDVAVATGKPTAAELGGVPCHCLDLTHLGEPFSVHDWLQHARAADDDIRARGRLVILVGGTGLYISSFISGFRAAEEDVDLEKRAERERVVAAGGLASLVDELARRDPAAPAAIDIKNPRRVTRALELLDQGWPTLADARTRSDARPALVLGVDRPRDEHRALVEKRAADMFGDTLRDEIRALRAAGVSDDDIGRAGIGYPEALRWIDGRNGRDEAVTETVTRTMQYASSQRTWWRSQSAVIWIDSKHTFAPRPEN